jgi:putative hemolysin
VLSDFILILVLIVANGVFAGAEIAIVALRRSRILELVEAGRRGARSVLALRSDPERFLATVQIGITVVSASAAAFGGSKVATAIVPLLHDIGVPPNWAERVALGLVVAVISYLSIVIGELVPKSLALHRPEAYALLVARPLLALSWIARPVVRLLTASSNVLLVPLGDRTTFTETRHSAEELQHIVEEAAKAGTVHPQVGEIASRAIDFADLTAGDVMVPREQLVMLPRHATADDIRRLLLEHGHSRIPLYEDRVDNVVGYLNVKDILAMAWERELIVLDDLVRPAYFVPDATAAVELLQEMRRRHVLIAMVVDERGGMEGIVTMEDLVEELVGEIFSEHVKHVPELFRRDPDGTVLVDGAAPVREINRALDLNLPDEEDWNSIAGLCLAIAGHIPLPGERITLDNGFVLEIVDATPRRVRRVRLHPPPHGDAAEETDDE